MCCVCILRTDQLSSLAAAALTLHSPPPTRILTTAYTSATHTDSACVAGSTKRTQSVCLSQRGPAAANSAGECEQCHVVSADLFHLHTWRPPPPAEMRSVAVSVSVCLSARSRAYLRNHMSKLHRSFSAYCLREWLAWSSRDSAMQYAVMCVLPRSSVDDDRCSHDCMRTEISNASARGRDTTTLSSCATGAKSARLDCHVCRPVVCAFDSSWCAFHHVETKCVRTLPPRLLQPVQQPSQ